MQLRKAITLREAVALYFGSVLGTGILISPALAVKEAHAASLWVWLAFMLLSYPVATSLGHLALRFPSAGGVSVYVREAFGHRLGTIAGWLFLSAFVFGSPAAALGGASYLATAMGLRGPWVFAIAAVIIGAAGGLNLAGVTLSGRTQFALMLGVMGFLVVVIVLGLKLFSWPAPASLVPENVGVVGLAGATIFWSFLGWENVVHAAEEFEDPRRDLRRAIALSVLLISILYFSLALVTVGADPTGDRYGSPQIGTAPFALLLADILGPPAVVAAGILAAVVTFGTINAYTLGVSRLTFGMAREASFPRFFDRLDPRTQAPRRSLLLLTAAGLALLLPIAFLGLSYEHLFLLVSASFILLYLLAAAAAFKLLERPILKAYALVTFAFFLIFLVLIIPYVLYPATASAAALLYLWWQRRRSPAGSPSGADPSGP